MTPFKISTSGDYVQLIYVDSISESVQQELRSDTDAFECSYDSDGKLFMQFGAMRFENPDPTDFTINGSQVTDAADFISKLNALFTGGGGSGSSFLPTTGTGTATGDITGEIGGGQILRIKEQNYQFPFLEINTQEDNERVTIGASNDTGDGVYASLQGTTNINAGNYTVTTFLGSSIENAKSSGVQTEITGTIGNFVSNTVYLADTHTFNGVINLPTQAAPGSPNDGDIWREDNTDTGLKIRINGVTKTIVVS